MNVSIRDGVVRYDNDSSNKPTPVPANQRNTHAQLSISGQTIRWNWNRNDRESGLTRAERWQ